MTVFNQEPTYKDVEQKDRQQAQKNVVKMRQNLGDRIPDPHLERRVRLSKPEFNQALLEIDRQDAYIPPDWDYKTAKLGPNNESLPNGAVGWTKYGEPYYGGQSPLAEWANIQAGHNRIWKDLDKEGTAKDVWGDISQDLRGAAEGGNVGDILKTGWSGLVRVFSEYLPKKIAGDENTQIADKTSVGDYGVALSRATGEVLKGVGLTLDVIPRTFKQSLSVVEGRGEYLEQEGKDKFEGLGDIVGGAIEGSLEDSTGFWADAGRWVAGAFQAITPVEWIVNSVRVGMDEDVGFEGLKEIDRMNWNAGRVMYSSFIDSAVREEYRRRWAAGENPYLLELELENPLAEAAGEIIFDPLNVLAAGAKGKNLTQTTGQSRKYVGNAVQDFAQDIQKITDNPQAFKATDFEGMAVKLETVNQRIVGNIDNLDSGKGFFKMTPNGKQNHMNRVASQIMSNDLVFVNGNPDKWYEIMKARAALASTDIDKRRKALLYLAREGLPMDAVLSEASLRFSNLINNFYFDEAGNFNQELMGMFRKIIDGEADNPEKLIKLTDTINEKYTEALEKTFPAYKDAEKTKALEKVLTPLENIANQDNLAGKVVGWVNSKGATLWMKLSSSFATRNWIANKFQIFMDFGIEGVRESFRLGDNRKTINKIFGGNVPEFMQQGYGMAGQLVTPLKAEEKVKLTDWFIDNTRRSGIYEGRDRLAISAYSMKKSWQNGKHVVLDATMLRERGVPDDIIRAATNILDNEYGNWDAAFPQIMELLGEETDYIKTFLWLDDQEKTWMRNYEVYDNLVDGIRTATTEEEAIQALQEAREQMRKMAASIDDETIIDDIADPVLGRGTALAEEAERFEKFSTSDELNTIYRKSKHANQNVEESFYKTLEQIAGYARQKGVDITDLVEGNPTWKRIFNQSFHDPTHKAQKLIQDTFETVITALRKKGAGSDEVAHANRVLRQWLPAEIPSNAAAKDAATYLFESVWWPQQRKAYAATRNMMIEEGSNFLTEILKRIRKAGVEVPGNTKELFKRTMIDFNSAQHYDFAMAAEKGKIVKLTAGSGQNYEAVVKLAYHNGVSTAYLKDGQLLTKDQHLLNIIEKYTGQKFSKVKDIPYGTAVDAFKARAAEQGTDYVQIATNVPEVRPEKITRITSKDELVAAAKVQNYEIVLDEMDPKIADGIRYYAGEMRTNLESQQKAYRGSNLLYNEKGDQVVGRTTFGYPDWYSEVGGTGSYYKGNKGKDAVEAALSDLVNGIDNNTALQQRLKNYILDQFEELPQDYVDDLLRPGKVPGESFMEEAQRLAKTTQADFENAEEWNKALDKFMDDMGQSEFKFMEPEEKRGLIQEMIQREGVVDETADVGKTIDTPSMVYDRGGQSLSNGVAYGEAMPELERRFDKIEGLIRENFNKKQKVVADQNTLDALMGWGKQVKTRAYEWRNIATDTSRAMGDFILHDYGSQRNIDLVLGLIYPYQFWYSRTYAKWLKRIVQDPRIISRYVRYKEYMAKIHAGMPEYFKYQINTNELFGMDSDHPLMFNLEATLNPLNGMTGVDFDDPARRVDGWTKLVDGIGRWGPSINPLLQYGTAFYMMAKGEEEAASHWGGRLMQQTNTLNTIGAMTGIDWLATTEFDPAVHLFSGGMDPWLRNRTGRALYQMQVEAEQGLLPWTAEEIYDAARTQKGEIWDQARIRAIQDRGPGQLASYFFGVGFKPRTQNDVQIDMMYQNLYGVLNMRDNLSPDEYKAMMADLNRKYPFMDTILTSKKVGSQRDTAYAWSILGRIPPGDSYQVYQMVGLDDDIVEKFYDSKGVMTGWAESDRNRFMASIVDMAAVLAMPDGMTQASWDTAKNLYSQVNTQIELMYGDDIQDKINHFYSLKDQVGDTQAYQYLEQHPEVSRAMDLKRSVIVNGPMELQAYYSSLSKISQYYNGKMWDEAKRRFGMDIFNTSGMYSSLTSKEDKKRFKKEHPELEEYWDFIESYKPVINQHIVKMGTLLPEGPGAQLRTDFEPTTAGVGAQELFQQIQQPQDPYMTYTPQQWQTYISEEGFELAVSALQGGLDYYDRQRLDYYAALMDMSTDQLIQYVGISNAQMMQSQFVLPNVP